MILLTCMKGYIRSSVQMFKLDSDNKFEKSRTSLAK